MLNHRHPWISLFLTLPSSILSSLISVTDSLLSRLLLSSSVPQHIPDTFPYIEPPVTVWLQMFSILTHVMSVHFKWKNNDLFYMFGLFVVEWFNSLSELLGHSHIIPPFSNPPTHCCQAFTISGAEMEKMKLTRANCAILIVAAGSLSP